MRPRLVIADDHEGTRSMLLKLLQRDYMVAGEAEDGEAAVEVTEAIQPDAVILDVSMPRMSGFDALRAIRKRLPHVPVVMVTQHAEGIYADEALRLGASAYVVKRKADTDLLPALERALSGGTWRSVETPDSL